jgi:plasmid maintenance system antidote protein VapI
MSKRLPPMHPGEVLREEFLVPLKLSAGALADEPRSLDLRARGAKKLERFLIK